MCEDAQIYVTGMEDNFKEPIIKRSEIGEYFVPSPGKRKNTRRTDR